MTKLLTIIALVAFTALSATAQTSGVAYRWRGGTAAPPATCRASAPTDIYYRTSTDVLYVCTAANTWTVGFTAGGGTGDVVGPASSTNNAVAIFDGTTGKLLKNGAGLLYDSTWQTVYPSAYQFGFSTTKTSNPPAGRFLLNIETSDGKLHCWDDAGADCMPAAGGGGWTDTGTVIKLATDTDNVAIGSSTAIFNDDGVTGANIGKWVAIDGGASGFAAYLGLGGTVPGITDRVGRLNFYNYSMGGVDNRTAWIGSENDGALGQGNLVFATTPNNVGPLARMTINYNGNFGIGKVASVGDTVSIKSHGNSSATNSLTIQNSDTISVFQVRDDGRVSLNMPGASLLLSGGTSGTIGVKAPATPTSYTLTLPPNDGTSGQYLTTDGAGVSTWADLPAGSGVTGTGTTGKLTKWSNGAGGVIADSLASESGANFTVNADVYVSRPGAADGNIRMLSLAGTQIALVGADNNGPYIDSIGSGTGPLRIAPATNFTVSATAPLYKTTTNCSDSAGAAACGSAAAGSVVIDAGATTVVVSTTAVTANSQIVPVFDSSLGTRLGVTCNTTIALPAITARTAGTSFTITVAVAPVTNPACYSYAVVN